MIELRTNAGWASPRKVYTKVAGTFRRVALVYVNVLGVWKTVWQDVVTAYAAASATSLVVRNAFTPEDWADPYVVKEYIVPQGVEIGASNTTYALALTSESEGTAGSFAGELRILVYGILSGRGGTANSGAGGHVLWMNHKGRSGQKCKVRNYGIIRAGGGGGGRGGNGGNGNYSYNYREPTSGWEYVGSWPVTWWEVGYSVYWRGSEVNQFATGVNSFNAGGWTYLRGPFHHTNDRNTTGTDDDTSVFSVARQQTRTQATTGGAGGAGGRGHGYNHNWASGSNGSAGSGTNAGTGGKGGDGGGWGQTGNTGLYGGHGNVTNGTAGAAGGLGGAYLVGNANCEFTNYGTVAGRVL